MYDVNKYITNERKEVVKRSCTLSGVDRENLEVFLSHSISFFRVH